MAKKKDNYTAITEFEIIAPTNEMEVIGEKLALSEFGEYCPDNSLRGYSLLHLLDHPLHYRVSKVTLRGKSYIIPADREKNYQPKFHPETMKYYLADKQNIPEKYLKAYEYLQALNDQVQEHGEIKIGKDHFYWPVIEELFKT